MIEVRNLRKMYGDYAAVNDVSFRVNEGETFALLGPNGSGKSTSLKCIVGLIQPTSGEIAVQGRSIAGKCAKDVRKRMSYLPQRISVQDNLTAREVMEFYCQLRKIPINRIDTLLQQSKFDFDGFADKRTGEFSGGMQQRLGLAIACLPDAPILILDEPTVSLDPEGAIGFREFLLDLKKEGKTILFSSHMLADVEFLADRVAILVGGRLIALESIQALREKLMRQSRMRIFVKHADLQSMIKANAACGQDIQQEGNCLLVTSSPENRLSILQAVQQSGATIMSFDTKDVSLEDVYVQYIHENQADHH